jgi:hypothetical protein
MPERIFMTRLFSTAGVLLVVLGLVLWFVLRIPGMFPPYLVTALLALGYGAYCGWSGRSSAAGKS